MHIAMASLYHYFRSYAFAHQMAPQSAWVAPRIIVPLNLAVIGMAYWILRTPRCTD